VFLPNNNGDSFNIGVVMIDTKVRRRHAVLSRARNHRILMDGFDVRRALTPALFCLGVAVNAAGLATVLARSGQPARAVATAFVCVNLLWLLAEAPVSLRPPSTPPREVATLIGYGLTRFSLVAAALIPRPLGPQTALREAVAAALFLGGIALRQIAIRALGRFYSHHVVRHDGHDVVSTGPYRLIRHPAYAGMLLAHAGLVLFFFNVWSAALFVGLCGMLSWRIRVEERTLRALPAYRAYAAGHARLLPGVW
jgi:protein-S-isoprenylcysteine O-methyltransferase Ste14